MINNVVWAEDLSDLIIDIYKELKTKLCEFVEENNIIGIKDYIEPDDISNILIVASKITFLSDNKKLKINFLNF